MSSSRLPLLHSRFSTVAHRSDLAMVHYLAAVPQRGAAHPFVREALRCTPHRVPRERRVCRFSADIHRTCLEDEIHVLFVCQYLLLRVIQLRDQFFGGLLGERFRIDLPHMLRFSPLSPDGVLHMLPCRTVAQRHGHDLFNLVHQTPLLVVPTDED